jgi:hypothetical protein
VSFVIQVPDWVIAGTGTGLAAAAAAYLIQRTLRRPGNGKGKRGL